MSAYTAKLMEDGDVEAFVLRCATAFTYDMECTGDRDKLRNALAKSAPVPVLPASVSALRDELHALEAMSPEAVHAKYQEERDMEERYVAEWNARQAVERDRLLAARDRLIDWSPPPELERLKAFAIRCLTDELNYPHDDQIFHFPATAEEWHQIEIETKREQLEAAYGRHQMALEDHAKAARWRNQILTATLDLRDK